MQRTSRRSSAAVVLLLYGFLPLSTAPAQRAAPGRAVADTVVDVVLQPYTGRTGTDEWSTAPDFLYPEVARVLGSKGFAVGDTARIDLDSAQKTQYGVWERVSMADGDLGRAMAPMARHGTFVLGLLGNCISSLGMLAGLQNSGPTRRPLRVGVIWIDAHADFNTPETTLSGWLGGMPVSIAAGQSLSRLRMNAGLVIPIATRDIVQMGQRDVDPGEQVLVANSQMTTITPAEMLAQGPKMQAAVAALAGRVDVIYLHIDTDILDASEIPGNFFATPNGPTAEQLAPVIRTLMENPKVRALGIASFPTVTDSRRERSLRSTMILLRAALDGLRERGS